MTSSPTSSKGTRTPRCPWRAEPPPHQPLTLLVFILFFYFCCPCFSVSICMYNDGARGKAGFVSDGWCAGEPREGEREGEKERRAQDTPFLCCTHVCFLPLTFCLFGGRGGGLPLGVGHCPPFSRRSIMFARLIRLPPVLDYFLHHESMPYHQLYQFPLPETVDRRA